MIVKSSVTSKHHTTVSFFAAFLPVVILSMAWPVLTFQTRMESIDPVTR